MRINLYLLIGIMYVVFSLGFFLGHFIGYRKGHKQGLIGAIHTVARNAPMGKKVPAARKDPRHLS